MCLTLNNAFTKIKDKFQISNAWKAGVRDYLGPLERVYIYSGLPKVAEEDDDEHELMMTSALLGMIIAYL